MAIRMTLIRFIYRYFTSLVLIYILFVNPTACDSSLSKDSSLNNVASGVLRAHPENPRYFTDDSGKAIYLTGSHTWANLMDGGTTDPPQPFDFSGYLDFLKHHNHNFIRLWTLELTQFFDRSKGMIAYHTPFPWERTGPGLALDGKPKFDLNTFNQEYFDRLRSRIIAARDEGIYVSVMLFEGWGIYYSEPPWRWDGHPFNINNNINDIDGDPNKDGKGLESHSLQLPKIVKRLIGTVPVMIPIAKIFNIPDTLKIQKDYVKKVIDTTNDLDNVLYEISNEDHVDSIIWQYDMINFIHSYEKGKPKQHPVGMTTHAKLGNKAVFNSSADWVSPSVINWEDEKDLYRIDPPATDGIKVMIADTDHLWGLGGDRQWVWKSFLRGYHTIYMDNLTSSGWGHWEPEDARKAMGHTLRYADKMNLASMTPRNDLSSTSYCLANPGKEYLIYQPVSNSSFTVNLTAGTYGYEWFEPGSGEISSPRSMTVSHNKTVSFTPPFMGDAVLYIHNS